MNVLSLFDGMSCAQIALQRAGIKIDSYYASEIDKYAIKVAQANFPETIQIGDVKEFNCNNLPKIDLLIGGSPCQGFSFAGKQLSFRDERSKLFFEYVRILRECKPKYFILENVKMKKEYQDIISKELGVEPILINSSLVSAQNRQRLYWTNIEGIEQPKDKNIYLKDIIENGICDREKSYCLDSNYFKGGNLKQYFEKKRRQLVFDAPIVTGEANISGYKQIRRTFDIQGKSPTITTGTGGNHEPKITINKDQWRKLTPLECERLQTVPDNYTNHVSNTQRYKMLGNGFTVDVIAHILKDYYYLESIYANEKK